MEDDLKSAGADQLGRLCDMFQEAEDATRTARELAERDRDYYDGWQLTDEQINTLKARGQPPVVINRIQRKVDWLRGLEAQRRTSPRAFPRTPQHEHDAEAASDAIKYVCDNEGFDSTASEVFSSMLVEGFGGVEVVHDERRGKIEISVNLYPWDRLFYDPHSRMADFSDARYLGAVIWMDRKQAVEKWRKAGDWLQTGPSSESDTYDDRPRSTTWVDAKRDRVRIVLIWWVEGGVWRWARFCGGAVLDSGESPYRDEDGDSVCPFVMQSAYVDRENRRYGVVRAMVDLQDEINKRRSKALHLLNQRQTMGDKGAVSSVAHAKRELARPDGHVEVTPGLRWELLNTNDMATGQFQLLQHSIQEMDSIAAADVLKGDTGASASGRAVMARQQGAMIELAPIFDRYQMFKKRVYRAIWNRIRQFWTEERWVRVTDDDRNVRFVGLNRPVTLEQRLRSMPEPQGAMMAQQMGLMPGDPRLGQVVGVQNPVSDLDVDIILDEVPAAVNLEGETFQALVQLVSSGAVPMPPAVLVETIPGLRRDKRDQIMQLLEQQQQQAAQQAQIAAQVGQQKAAADIQETMAKAAKAAAEPQLRAAELEFEAFKAGASAA